MCLLTNFSLWARAPPEFQFGLVTSVLEMVRNAPENFRRIISVEGILESIRSCCPDDLYRGQELEAEKANTGGAFDVESMSESSYDDPGATLSAERVWTTLASRERLHMRGFLWEIVRLLLKRQVSQQDGDSLVQMLASCNDSRLVRPSLTWQASYCSSPINQGDCCMNANAALKRCHAPASVARPFVQVCELVRVVGSLMRQPVPPTGLFRALESASLAEGQGGFARRGSKPDSTPPVSQACM